MNIPPAMMTMVMDIVKRNFPDIPQQVEQFGAILGAYKTQLDRIEARLKQIEETLKLETHLEEIPALGDLRHATGPKRTASGDA